MMDAPCSEVVWRVLATHSFSPVSPALPLPRVTACHHIPIGLYIEMIRNLKCVSDCGCYWKASEYESLCDGVNVCVNNIFALPYTNTGTVQRLVGTVEWFVWNVVGDAVTWPLERSVWPISARWHEQRTGFTFLIIPRFTECPHFRRNWYSGKLFYGLHTWRRQISPSSTLVTPACLSRGDRRSVTQC